MAINIVPSVNKVLESGFEVIWVPKARAWFEWNREIHAWVVVDEDYIYNKVEGILHQNFQAALLLAAQNPVGSESVLEEALKVMKEPQIKRIVNALKSSRREEPEILQTRLSVPDANDEKVEVEDNKEEEVEG